VSPADALRAERDELLAVLRIARCELGEYAARLNAEDPSHLRAVITSRALALVDAAIAKAEAR
jgi:hypothetical protein